MLKDVSNTSPRYVAQRVRRFGNLQLPSSDDVDPDDEGPDDDH